MNSFHKDGRRGIVDESDKEASYFVVESSFRLTNLTNPHKYVKNKEPKDADMEEAAPKKKKERKSVYNSHTDENRRR
ncbi:hypothetical protein BD408DRAFT_388621 [Parasitella parasitica]|nr:hypothetical protein BD408DRAFT_388621 [Parasitella parasitica]